MNKKLSLIAIIIALIIISTVSFLALSETKKISSEKDLKQATLKWLKDNEIKIEKEFELSLFQLTGSGYFKMIEEKKADKYLSPSSVIKINEKKEIKLEKKYTSKKNFEEAKDLKYNYKGKYNETIQLNAKVNFEDLIIEVGNGKYNPELIITDENNYETLVMTNFERIYTLTYYVHIDKEKLPFTRIIEVKDTVAPIIKFEENTNLKVSEVKNFDFKKDVEVTDNGEDFKYYIVMGTVEAIPGKYNITYIANDMYGNETEKTRTITVE